MARRYRSPEDPRFDTYPSSVSEPGRNIPAEPPVSGIPAPDVSYTSPGQKRRDTQIKDQGRRIGEVMGRAVETLREGTDRAVETFREGKDRAVETLRESGERLQGRLEVVRDRLRSGERASELRDRASMQAEEWKVRGRSAVADARVRAQHFVRENPGKVILAGGAIGVLLGAVLRTTLGRKHE